MFFTTFVQNNREIRREMQMSVKMVDITALRNSALR